MSLESFDFQQDHFQLFELARQFQIDSAHLEQRYRLLQAQVHPDKFAQASAAEQRAAMQRATHVNEAYQTLRTPLNRARYLLRLHGLDTQEDTNTAMPMDFLVAQMAWREAVVEAQQARDVDLLDALQARMQEETRLLEQQLAVKIDLEHDYASAVGIVRKLRFMEKLAEEIHAAYDAIDD